MNLRGVLLAGGKGTRLGELTKVTNKHLLPVGRWPMLVHPLLSFIQAGVRDIMLVSGVEHMGDIINYLGSGSQFNCKLTYRVQDEAGGIAQALGLAEDFCHDSHALVILGDNIFKDSIQRMVDHAALRPAHARIILAEVADPQRYGVAELSQDATITYGRILSIEEKPAHPKSRFAVTGIYLYPPDVFEVIKSLKPSARGELEITDVNNFYLACDRLSYSVMNGEWTDAGTFESLARANQLMAE